MCLIAALPIFVGPCSFELCLCMLCMPLCKLWISVCYHTVTTCLYSRKGEAVFMYVCVYIHVYFCVGLLQSEASSCSELELFCWCSCVCLFVHLCAYMFWLFARLRV